MRQKEMKEFLAGLLLSSISPQPNKNKYWSSSDHVPKILAESIRRDRFLAIMRNVHLVNNLNSAASTDRAKKLDPCSINYRDHSKSMAS